MGWRQVGWPAPGRWTADTAPQDGGVSTWVLVGRCLWGGPHRIHAGYAPDTHRNSFWPMVGVNSISHNNLLPKSCRKSPRRPAGGFRRLLGAVSAPGPNPSIRDIEGSRQTGKPGGSRRRKISSHEQSFRMNPKSTHHLAGRLCPSQALLSL